MLELETALADVIGLLHSRAAQQRLDVRHQVPSPAPGLTVDHATFKQVLYIIIENAIAFAPPGSRISVSAGPVLGVRERGVMITVVADAEVAIARDSEHYAERGYEQLDPRGGRAPVGAHGRRLATARTVAELLGGALRISQPAGNVLFAWLLPTTPDGSVPRNTGDQPVG